MGTPRVIARDVAIPLDGVAGGGGVGGGVVVGGGVGGGGVGGGGVGGADAVRGTLVDVGNPHCVLFVDDERTAPVATLGPLVEKHSMFPRGTNVEFLAVRGGRVFLRVWERGVGETQACGSGACAAAVAAVERGLARHPVRLELPGGTLEVDADGRGGVFLSGPVEEHSTLTFDLSTREKARENQARAPR
jgi:diaminopimelate epimerase